MGCPFILAAAAAVVLAAVPVATAEGAAATIAEQQNQNDDPPPVVVQAAADTVIVTAHKITSEKIFPSGSPLIPWYSGGPFLCRENPGPWQPGGRPLHCTLIRRDLRPPAARFHRIFDL